MYKENLALNNLQWLICHKIKSNRSNQKEYAVFADNRVEIKDSKKTIRYLNLAKELKKKTTEHEGDGGTNCCWCS